jgi:L-ornithine Nalpha-acyltransferase
MSGFEAITDFPATLLPLPPTLPPIQPKRHAPNDLPESLGRIGSLEARLARSGSEIRRSQALRYQVFFEERVFLSGLVSPATGIDEDAFDAICDHLIIVDHDDASRVVGTYRLLRQESTSRHGGFYSSSEFELGAAIAAHPGLRFLELGRSCVLKPYRSRRTIELLWRGIWAYTLHHRIDVMLGCASLEGTDPAALAAPLSFLHHHASAEGIWRIPALRERRVEMGLLPLESVDTGHALRMLPPLIKGYLRLGARFGDGAVIDHAFGTTDVLAILKIADIDPRYIDYYGSPSPANDQDTHRR